MMNFTQEQVNSAQQQVIQQLKQNPQLQQALQQVLPELMNDPDITPETLAEAIRVLEFGLQNPQAWGQLREMLIKSGVADEDDLPAQYDGAFIMTMLAAFYTLRDQMEQPRPFARGGLNAIRAQGRNGDTVLAHISPFEDSVLRAYGGSGRINPNTGLREYGFWKSVTKVFKAVAPIAAVLIPGVGAAIGSAIGLGTGTAAAIAGNAILQGGIAALTGGNVGKAALMGGLTGGLSSGVGEWANTNLGLGLGQAGQAILGSGIIGGVAGEMTGQGFLPGAIQGAAGQAVGQSISGLGSNFSSPAVQQGFQTAGQQYGNLMTAGYTPSQALQGSALSGLVSGTMYKPAAPASNKTYSDAYEDYKRQGFNDAYAKQAALNDTISAADSGDLAKTQTDGTVDNKAYSDAYEDYKRQGFNDAYAKQAALNDTVGATDSGTTTTQTPLQAAQVAATQTPAATTPAATDGLGANWSTVGKGLMLATLLGGASTPEQVQQQAAQQMTPEQLEYFNRRTAYIDWDKVQEQAKAAGTDLGSYVAQNWDKMNKQMQDESVRLNPPDRNYARGGALNRLARGGGSGRADTIPARLSDGEYVIDAETVALLGDGSTTEGARRLDNLRSNVRRQKGKALARGKISPNAKSPLAYLKGAA